MPCLLRKWLNLNSIIYFIELEVNQANASKRTHAPGNSDSRLQGCGRMPARIIVAASKAQPPTYSKYSSGSAQFRDHGSHSRAPARLTGRKWGSAVAPTAPGT